MEEQKTIILINRLALNMVGVPVDEQTTDLILRALAALKERGDQMNLQDAIEIRRQWDAYWDSMEIKATSHE